MNPWDQRRSAHSFANNFILYLSCRFLGLLTLSLESMYNLDVVSFDPHLRHTGFSMATGLTRTVAVSLNYLSSRSPTIHPSLPTSSRTSLKGCVSWATMRKRPVSAVCIFATSLRSAYLASLHSGLNHRQANRTCSAHRFPCLRR